MSGLGNISGEFGDYTNVSCNACVMVVNSSPPIIAHHWAIPVHTCKPSQSCQNSTKAWSIWESEKIKKNKNASCRNRVHRCLTIWRLLLPYEYSYKVSCAWPGTLTLRAERQSARISKITNYKWLLNPVWHRMLYSYTLMVTVGVKGLRYRWQLV